MRPSYLPALKSSGSFPGNSPRSLLRSPTRTVPKDVLRCQLPVLLWSLTFVLLAGSLTTLPAAPYPPGISEFDLRITNRRFVSHLLFEHREGRNAITILLSHGPNYNAFHDIPHALHFFCGTAMQCLQTSDRIDTHLRSGYNLGLNLKGSRIVRLEFLHPDHR